MKRKFILTLVAELVRLKNSPFKEGGGMEKNNFRHFLIFIVLVGFMEGCSTYAGCTYSRKIKQEIVFPLLTQKFGDYRFFNYETPLVYKEHGRMELKFISVNDVDGYRLLPDSNIRLF